MPLGPEGAGCDDLLDAVPRELPVVRRRKDRSALAVLAADLCPPSCGVQTLRWREPAPLVRARFEQALPELVRSCLRVRGTLLLDGRPPHSLELAGAGSSFIVRDRTPAAPPATDLLLTGLDLDEERLRALLDRCRTARQPEHSRAPVRRRPFLGRTSGPDR